MNADVLVLVDCGGGPSLTNCMEKALARVVRETGKPLPQKIVYQDSQGIYDGVDASDPDNVGFILLNARSEEDAVRALNNLYEPIKKTSTPGAPSCKR